MLSISNSMGHYTAEFVKIQLGRNFNISFVTVPIKSIVHPLCIFPDDGDQTDKYFVVLPKRYWSHFFGNNIVP
jgi:hypothetical protein